MRELKAQVVKLLATVKNTIPVIAEAMETVRQNMLIFRYQLLHTQSSKRKISNTFNVILPDFRKYTEIVNHLKDKKNAVISLPGKKLCPFFVWQSKLSCPAKLQR
ncbi:MAG: hypothetical protein AB7C97_12525 [Oscillospiraceae bacterium]